MLRFRAADTNQILAITGRGIKDIKVVKEAWIFPGQKYVRVDLDAETYEFQVQAMSSEKLLFILPAVFTIGPRIDNMESLILYSRLLAPHDKQSPHVTQIIKGIIEGETRVLAASMTMEAIFKGTKEFKQEVFEKVQLELDQFGLKIYNANVKQLVDVPGHEYFSYLGQKTQMEAANQAKVDVAEAKMKGAIGAKEREGKTVQNASAIDADTKIISTQRQGEASKEEIKVKTAVQIFEYQKEADLAEANAELAKKKAAWSKAAKLAEVESAKAVAMREVELQMEVEKKNALTRIEKLKAESLSKASVDYEIKVQEANWVLYQKQKAAEAILYENQKAAEAQRMKADAEFYAKKREADAITTLAQAQGNYLSTLLKPLEGNYTALRDYMMINDRVYQDIANINAQAVKGLQPKISIWSNGSNGGGEDGNGGGGMKDVAGVYSMLPPLFKSVQDHTRMLPPAWLGTLTDARSSTTSTISAD